MMHGQTQIKFTFTKLHYTSYQNKFEKLVNLVGFIKKKGELPLYIIENCWDMQSAEKKRDV
jgi:hypothetical protein